MTEPFSPAAQAVRDAAFHSVAHDKAHTLEARVAAALRAAADQVEDLEVPWPNMGDSYLAYERGQTSAAEHLRTIAAELEAT